MKIRNSILLGIMFFLVTFGGCLPQPQETPTKGYLKCYVDESLYNVVKDERDLFVDLYEDSKIDLIPVSAREGIAAVINGDAKMFVSSRNLNEEETGFIRKNKSGVKIFKFCYDGIAVIVNSNNGIEKMDVDELTELLLGTKKNISVIIPESNSGVYEFVKDELLKGKYPAGAEIAGTEKEVIDKVKKDKNSVGLVGLDLLKNESGVFVLEIGGGGQNLMGKKYIEPLPGYLVNGEYPLMRTTYIFLNEIGLHVASGFTTFLTSNEGQRVVMKNDLGPATVPVKLIQLN